MSRDLNDRSDDDDPLPNAREKIFYPIFFVVLFIGIVILVYCGW